MVIDNKKPTVSIIMPAYNVEKYISHAIKSVLDQTYEDWELIIIDDCSEDNTRHIVCDVKDDRVFLYKTENNSGAAFFPRKIGIGYAKGEWILNVDADDYIPKDYIEKMLYIAEKNTSDIVGSQQVSVYENGVIEKPFHSVPDDTFNYNMIIDGRTAFNYTLPRWIIAMNGALIRRNLWEKAISEYYMTKHRTHDDENLSRMMLSNAKIVSFCKIPYYYRDNPVSVTHRFNYKGLDYMDSNGDLINYTTQKYGIDSNEIIGAKVYDYICYRHLFGEFMLKKIGDKDADYNKSLSKLRKWHNRIDWKVIRKEDHGLKKYILSLFELSIIVTFIRNKVRKIFRCGASNNLGMGMRK